MLSGVFLMMDEPSKGSYQGHYFNKSGIHVNSFYHWSINEEKWSLQSFDKGRKVLIF